MSQDVTNNVNFRYFWMNGKNRCAMTCLNRENGTVFVGRSQLRTWMMRNRVRLQHRGSSLHPVTRSRSFFSWHVYLWFSSLSSPGEGQRKGVQTQGWHFQQHNCVLAVRCLAQSRQDAKAKGKGKAAAEKGAT